MIHFLCNVKQQEIGDGYTNLRKDCFLHVVLSFG